MKAVPKPQIAALVGLGTKIVNLLSFDAPKTATRGDGVAMTLAESA